MASKAETKYNSLIEKREKLNEELREAKREMDADLEQARREDLLKSLGIEPVSVDGKVELRPFVQPVVSGEDEEE